MKTFPQFWKGRQVCIGTVGDTWERIIKLCPHYRENGKSQMWCFFMKPNLSCIKEEFLEKELFEI